MIITLAHDKGGTGKSLTCFNLMATFKPDITVDLDTRNDISVLNNLRPENKRFNVVNCNSKKELISALKQSDEGKTILVDCGGFDSELTSLAISVADIVVTPCNGSITEKNGLRSFSKILSRQSKHHNKNIKGFVLLNRTEPNKRNFDAINDFINSAPNLTRLNTIIPRRNIIADSAERGLSVFEVKSKSDTLKKAQSEFKTLTKELKEIL